MPSQERFTSEERLVVLYLFSRGFSRSRVSEILRAEFGCGHSDDKLQRLLDEINVSQDQQGRIIPSHNSQRQEVEWNLDAVDSGISGLGRQLPADLADRLKRIRTLDGKMLFPDKSEDDLTRNRDPAREPYPAMHPPNPAGVPATTAAFDASPNTSIPVILAPTNPTIVAFSPLTPGRLPVIQQDPALLGTMFGEPRGTFYDRIPPRGGAQLTYPGQHSPPDEPGTSDIGIGNAGGGGGTNTGGGDMSRSGESGTKGSNDSGSSGDGKEQGHGGGN